MHRVVTKDEVEHSGALIRETDAALVLLLSNGTQTTVDTSDIRKREKLNQSVMPNGYELFGDAQLADLTAFLLTLRNAQ